MKTKERAKAKEKEQNAEDGYKLIATNKNATRSYTLFERFEAGVVLLGTEVKALRASTATLKDCYAILDRGELYVKNFSIKPYDFGNINNHVPLRTKKLLLHKQEIHKLTTKMAEKGFTLVVVKVYFKRGKVKLEVALAKGKTSQDRRQDIKERDAKRDIARSMKQHGR